MSGERKVSLSDIGYRQGYEAGKQVADAEARRLKGLLDDREGKLAGIADVLNQELRENGGSIHQVWSHIESDMRPAIRALVDCVRRRRP